MSARIDIPIGSVFGRLMVVKELRPYTVPSTGKSMRRFLCRCECGKKTKPLMSSLRSGHTTSCGCFRIEQVVKSITTHGLYNHPLYKVHSHMLERCADKNSSRYGGRGIRVCKSWRDPETGLQAFIEWNDNLPKRKRWRPGLEIDRRDNDKGYRPSNCRWVTHVVNTRNRENTLFVREGPYKGTKLADLLDKIGDHTVSLPLADGRYRRGWSAIAACATPKGLPRRAIAKC